jgi:LysR family transcriptional regulator, glycine cleavage system transcriptional activator
MDKRKSLPLAALRAFEATARHGRFTAAAEELGVSHGAISKHIRNLEDVVGTPLFEGVRNRPILTAEGRIFGFALTAAFDQIDDALRIVSRRDNAVLDVACLSTFAMRWLIPRLHDFAAAFPQYDVRLSTDDRQNRVPVDVRIMVLQVDAATSDSCRLLFQEQLGVVMAPAVISSGASPRAIASSMPRIETRTRPHVWGEWSRLIGERGRKLKRPTRVFDHYHLTIEAALNGLGAAVVPWHLVAGDVNRGRLIAPWGFVESGYRYVVQIEKPGRRKTEDFIGWLTKEMADLETPHL